MPDLETVIRPKAYADLNDIWLYTSRQWSVSQAENYIVGLHQAFARLADMPEIARERLETTPSVRIYQSGKHNIIYRVQNDTLIVERVMHVRRNWQAYFTS